MSEHREDLHADPARRLGDVVEPIAAAVYFSPEAQSRYEALASTTSRATSAVARPTLGAAPWRVVSAAFVAFKPAVVDRAVVGGGPRRHRPSCCRPASPAPATKPPTAAHAAVVPWPPPAPPSDGVDVRDGRCSAGWPGCPCPAPTTRSAGCGGPPTGCGDTGATGTSPRGRRTSTPSRSRRSPSRGGTSSWTATCGPGVVRRRRGPGPGAGDRGGPVNGDGAITDAGRDQREPIEGTTDTGDPRRGRALGDGSTSCWALLAPVADGMLGDGGYPAERVRPVRVTGGRTCVGSCRGATRCACKSGAQVYGAGVTPRRPRRGCGRRRAGCSRGRGRRTAGSPRSAAAGPAGPRSSARVDGGVLVVAPVSTTP